MAKKTYIGVDNVAQVAKKMYIGVNDKAKKVKKAYVGVDGIAKQIFSGATTISYSGNYKILGDLNSYWELVLLSDGILNFSTLNTDAVDVFLVGGGQTGGAGWYDNPSGFYVRVWSGKGGDGGNVKTVFNARVNENKRYPCVIGKGGDRNVPEQRGTNSSITELDSRCSSEGGSHTTGGVHALINVNYAGPGENGYPAFWDGNSEKTGPETIFQNGFLYGASSGGGASIANHQSEGVIKYPPGDRAETNGKTGGTPYGQKNIHGGESPDPNTGHGSGPKGSGENVTYPAGIPGTGIIIIRPTAYKYQK